MAARNVARVSIWGKAATKHFEELGEALSSEPNTEPCSSAAKPRRIVSQQAALPSILSLANVASPAARGASCSLKVRAKAVAAAGVLGNSLRGDVLTPGVKCCCRFASLRLCVKANRSILRAA